MSEVVEVSVPSVLAVTDNGTEIIEVVPSAQTVLEVGYSQPGGGGGGGGGAGYFAQQFMVPSTTFTVNHNLGQFPAVTFVNSSGVELIGDVTYNNANTFTLTFSAAESGWVYCN